MTEWREIQGRFSSFDGTRLHVRRYIPKEATCYTIMLVHGFGEHAGRYMNFVNHFVPKGYEIYAIDLRGHGLSEGARGHVDSFSDYIRDLEALRDKIDAERPKKCGLEGGNILVGHSMGGLIALTYAIKNQASLSAVVASGPLLKLALEVPGWKKSMGQFMSKILPKFSMPNGLDPKDLSRDPQVAPLYMRDPLVNFMVSSRWFTEATAAMDAASNGAGQLKLPTLIMHGSADKLCAADGSKAFYEKCGSSDKTIKIYEGFYHEIFNELGFKGVMNDIEAWLKARNL